MRCGSLAVTGEGEGEAAILEKALTGVREAARKWCDGKWCWRPKELNDDVFGASRSSTGAKNEGGKVVRCLRYLFIGLGR
jgi:hypothetical protein